MTMALRVNNLTKVFGGGKSIFGKQKSTIHAVNGISFDVVQGTTLGIVGESGCGKSTLARMLVGLLPPTSGTIEIEGKILSDHSGDVAAFGRLIQYVFQDPISSLNPRKTIRQVLEAPLIHLLGMDEASRNARISELIAAVNLRDDFLNRYPHEFSGGQAQRIGIARALAASPRILVLDEPVSALDVSVQAQVLNLLKDLQKAFNLTYLFISHDLAVVEAISDQVSVLYFGKKVELGSADEVFGNAMHPYTQLLAQSCPVVGRPLANPEGSTVELPDPMNPPSGCSFTVRCPRVQKVCYQTSPAIEVYNENHEAACHNPRQRS